MKIYECKPYREVALNAALLKNLLDRNCISAERMNCYYSHMTDCLNNPTVGAIARNQFIESVHKENPIQFKMNQLRIKGDTLYKHMHELLVNKEKELYPRSGELRNKIIKNKLVVIGKIKSVRDIDHFIAKLFKRM